MSTSISDRMRAGVEFINAGTTSTFRGASVEHYDFKGKRVAFLTPPDPCFFRYVRSRNPACIVVFSSQDPEDGSEDVPCEQEAPRTADAEGLDGVAEAQMQGDEDPHVVQIDYHSEGSWAYEDEPFDFAFFDRDQVLEFDDVAGTHSLGEWLSRNLSRTGVCFALLRTGIVQSDWDVFNSIVLTPEGRLPSSPYFYERLMGTFAVRPLVRVATPARKHSVSRVFRLARRAQTLLLVAGHSQAGKTTLARELRANSPHSHLASDYIFFNLFQLRAEKSVPGRGKTISKLLGTGSAEATGNFFRLIEEDEQLLFEYLDTASYLMPPEPNIVSVDIDLRKPEVIEKARQYLTDKGFNVWLVTRTVPTIVHEIEVFVPVLNEASAPGDLTSSEETPF